MPARLPESPSILGHIFRSDEGHVPDTPANRARILGVANDERNYLYQDLYGSDWYTKVELDGTETWAAVRNGIIKNGGVNEIPILPVPRGRIV